AEAGRNARAASLRQGAQGSLPGEEDRARPVRLQRLHLAADHRDGAVPSHGWICAWRRAGAEALRGGVRADARRRGSAGPGGGRRYVLRLPGEVARAGRSLEAERGGDEVGARPAHRPETGRAVREVGGGVAAEGEDRRERGG